MFIVGAMNKIPEDIKQLDEKIRSLQKKEQKTRQSGPKNEYTHAASTGFRIGVELVSGVIVGSGIGWLLDSWINTSPYLLVVFLLLGGCAGFLNVYRYAKNEEKAQE